MKKRKAWNSGMQGVYSLRHSGQFKKGFTPWNKGIKGSIKSWNKGKKGIYSKATIELMSKAKRGKPSPHKGERGLWKHTKEWKIENGLRMIGNQINKGRAPYNKGKVHMSLDKHWNWQGGKSFEPYAPSWNSQVKERIRVRDNFTCQVCKVPELEFNRKLDVHHIDYNKKNCKENNLVSLCNSCHTKTNKNRKYWKNYFNQMLHNIKEVLPCCL